MPYLLILISVLGLKGSFAQQQSAAQNEQEDVYLKVPADQRQQLKDALGKLVDAEKKRDWKAVYEMTDHNADFTEDAFLKLSGQMHALREFRVWGVEHVPTHSDWFVEGCAAYRGTDKPGAGRRASVEARWADARWHLSLILIEARCQGDPVSCSTR